MGNDVAEDRRGKTVHIYRQTKEVAFFSCKQWVPLSDSEQERGVWLLHFIGS